VPSSIEYSREYPRKLSYRREHELYILQNRKELVTTIAEYDRVDVCQAMPFAEGFSPVLPLPLTTAVRP
jgi:hypothetical protein